MALLAPLPPQRTAIDLENAATKPERQLIKRYRVIWARSLTKRQQKPMPRAHDNFAGTHFTVLQGTARMRALAVEDINISVDFRNTYKLPLNLAYLDFTQSKTVFSNQASPLSQQYKPITLETYEVLRSAEWRSRLTATHSLEKASEAAAIQIIAPELNNGICSTAAYQRLDGIS
jgi:hypothetical protein